MEHDNTYELRGIVQRGIGRRELRYGLMRIARVATGWPTWVAGFAMLAYGAVRAGMVVLRADAYNVVFTLPVMMHVGGLVLLAVGGIAVIMIGLSMAVPYQFDTFMPGTQTDRQCLSCGHPIPPNQVFPVCENAKCRSWFPLDIQSYIGRILSKTATIINVIIMIATAFLLVAK